MSDRHRDALTFRYARPSDLTDLNHISVTAKSYWGYPAEWIEQWKRDLRVTEKDLAKRMVLLAESDRDIVGFTIISETETKYEVDHLWVLPEFMGRGHGRELLQWAMDKMMTKSKRILVIADPNAEGFYEKMGFQTYDQVESYPPGRFLPLMRHVGRE